MTRGRESYQAALLHWACLAQQCKKEKKDYGVWDLGGRRLCHCSARPLLQTSCLSQRGTVLARGMSRIVLRVIAMYQVAFDWLAVRQIDMSMLWGSSSCYCHARMVRHRRKGGVMHVGNTVLDRNRTVLCYSIRSPGVNYLARHMCMTSFRPPLTRRELFWSAEESTAVTLMYK